MTELDDLLLALDAARHEILERLPDVPADQPPTRRTRLTKDDVLAAHLAALTKHRPESHSVTLKSNAKGETQIEVTVRTDPEAGIATPAEALAEASRLYVQACQTFAAAGFSVTPQGGASGGGQA